MSTSKGKLNSWSWEVERVKLRKTAEYGESYSAVIDFVVVNDDIYAVGLHADEFTREDMRTLSKIANALGYDKVIYNKYKKLKKKTKSVRT